MGLVVNCGKTKICIFHRYDQPTIQVRVADNIVKSKKSVNVLGVTFDSKLTWAEHISNTISKSNKALHAIRMIKFFFTRSELKILLNAHYFSTLYYNSEIWLTPFLHAGPKQQLLSASANAIRLCMKQENYYISFKNIHVNFGKSTPKQMALYKISLQLYKTFNSNDHGTDWLEFSNQIISSGRQTVFNIHRSNNYTIGLNMLANKFTCITNKIKLDYCNLSYSAYKHRMKIIFLPFECI